MYKKLMAPSRGLVSQFILHGTTISLPRSFFVRRHYSSSSSSSSSSSPSPSSSSSSSSSSSPSSSSFSANAVSDFIQHATNPINKTQIYISRTHDPFINLSIEHYLLQKTPADSTVLFLYTNQRSVVMGRNQNPWNEVNLNLVKHSEIGDISLVRRRSGGGTVFHDVGNVNYCVVCPTSQFDRDKHAEMVVRALHKLGVDRAMVNTRHDIVLKPSGKGESEFRIFKVSGSAYKLTRERSLHHGTCLLNSPSIRNISKYLRSPAARFIKARGVESVSSPVKNVKVANKAFEDAVVAEFAWMYGYQKPIILYEDLKEVPEIAKGLEELTSPDWIFSQTPQFTFSTDQSDKPKKKRHPLPRDLPPGFKASFTARNGVIIEADIQYDDNGETVQMGEEIVNKKIHEIDWNELPNQFADEPLKWFFRLFSYQFKDWRGKRKRNT